MVAAFSLPATHCRMTVLIYEVFHSMFLNVCVCVCVGVCMIMIHIRLRGSCMGSKYMC